MYKELAEHVRAMRLVDSHEHLHTQEKWERDLKSAER